MREKDDDREDSPAAKDKSGYEEEDTAEAKNVEKDENRSVDWEDFLNDSDHWEYRPQAKMQVESNVEVPQPHIPTLSEHLYDQLHLDNISGELIAIGEHLIGNINRDGYIEIELEELSQRLKLPLEKIQAVHSRLLEYEPIGIGSRDLRECLLVQLRHKTPPVPAAIRIIDEFWNDFINKRFEILADKLDVDIGEIKEVYHVISKLNPKPGEGYFDERQNYVIPDLIVHKVSGEFVVYLNDGDIPNFRINQAYREMFTSKKRTDKSVKEFLSRKLETARWFINAIHQRRTTMIRTMRAIVHRQISFFEKGHSQLKPMILANIAEDISMDISTISRVTNGKYVQTDWGVFELKYFFSEKMETAEGDDVSNRVIKARLKEMIGEENKHKPLSDQELTDMLNEEGFRIQRRTVAKYRQQMRIPIKRLRREI